MNNRIEINNLSEMYSFGMQLSKELSPGDIIYLEGNLGAGKTTLVQCILKSLGYTGHVKSPTYTLVEEYKVNKHIIYHYDLYRLSDPEELEWIGCRDNFNDEAISLIEWPQKGVGYLPMPTRVINIEYDDINRIIYY